MKFFLRFIRHLCRGKMEKDKKIERVAGMLEEASKLLRTPTNAASSTGSEGRPQETGVPVAYESKNLCKEPKTC